MRSKITTVGAGKREILITLVAGKPREGYMISEGRASQHSPRTITIHKQMYVIQDFTNT